jgi:hypothetical protein
MFRCRVESHISITFGDIHFSASVGVDSTVPVRSPRIPARPASDLAAELEQYTTHADLLDLHAALDRHDDRETEEIRSILAAQAWKRAHQTSRQRILPDSWPYT